MEVQIKSLKHYCAMTLDIVSNKTTMDRVEREYYS